MQEEKCLGVGRDVNVVVEPRVEGTLHQGNSLVLLGDGEALDEKRVNQVRWFLSL